ncbi:hypothetical protein [Rubritalea halochordaticola]|uniref:hypothetical protein n=1 Tax=Rubritalea halochordaticola TaxID=714537 RepID=UPI0031FDB4BB
MNNDTMDNELRDLENQLGRLSPMAMPEDMLARMEQAMDRWREHTPVEEKIVQFQSQSADQKSSKFYIWASAAAIALIGAVSTVLMAPDNANPGASAVAQNTAGEVEQSVTPLRQQANIVPVANTPQFDTKITDEPSYSITYDAEGRPHRLVKVRFEDEITLYDDKGRPVKVKKPRIEYYLVPVQVR